MARRMSLGGVWLVAVGSACGTVIGQETNTTAPATQPDLHVTEFGEHTGQEINDGFVFADGRYLDAPYRVARRGCALFVNGVMVQDYKIKWPPYKLEVERDPGIPAGLTRESTFEKDPSPDAHWRRKWRYLLQHFPPEEAPDRMAEYFRSLPFVKSAVFQDPPHNSRLNVTTWEGKTAKFWLSAEPENVGRKTPTREEIASWLEEKRQHIEERLSKGYCIMYFNASLERAMDGKRAMMVLPPIVEVLSSDRTDDEKFDVLEQWDVIMPVPDDRRLYGSLVKNFRGSTQLSARVADIRKKHPPTTRPLSYREHLQILQEVGKMDSPPNEREALLRKRLRDRLQAVHDEEQRARPAATRPQRP